jgi:Pyrimidine dimer DNA glycosylase
MNIFVTDMDPARSASYLDDKRVIKMILESAQLLSAAVRLNNFDVGYKLTHKNHPCSIWTRQSKDNFDWLVEHTYALGNVYTNAYEKVHKTISVVDELRNYSKYLPSIGLTEFANCTTLFKDEDDVIIAYKKYMTHKWNNDKRLPTWKNRDIPEFYMGIV